jgi:hypothetical protein
MEVLPHFWINYYSRNNNFIKEKKIDYIIHLSKNESFLKKNNIEEIRIPIEYDCNESIENINNLIYQYLFDVTDNIHNKILSNNNILLIGYNNKQDVDAVIIAYLIKYGKLTVNQSILFLKTKKNTLENDNKFIFYHALNRFYYELNK